MLNLFLQLSKFCEKSYDNIVDIDSFITRTHSSCRGLDETASQNDEEIDWPSTFGQNTQLGQSLRQMYLSLQSTCDFSSTTDNDCRENTMSCGTHDSNDVMLESRLTNVRTNPRDTRAWRRFGVMGRPILAHTDIVLRSQCWNWTDVALQVTRHIIDHFEI